MKSLTVTNMQGAALWTLAHHLGHEWAGGESDRDSILADGWDAVSERVNAEMEASHAEQSEARSSLPAGLWPATGHTTGSGRLSWYCRSYGNAVVIEVNRPAPGLRGSNSVVLRLSAEYTPDGWILADFESVPSMIELRHIQALAECLYENPEDFDYHCCCILDQIADADLTARLRPEISAAHAARMAYQAEEQARIDGYRLAEEGRRERLDALDAEQDRLEAC